jgi:hypothetical protein
MVRNEILASFPYLQGHTFQLRKATSGGPNKKLVPVVDDQSVPAVSVFIYKRCGLIYIVPANDILPDIIEVKNTEPEF